jgi:hypothetical protein
MKKFAFISRHTPTPEQHALAQAKGIELIPVGDMDAFTVQAWNVNKIGDFCGVIVVHPATALRLCKYYEVGVFENENRAPEGERPTFIAKALHLYDV